MSEIRSSSRSGELGQAATAIARDMLIASVILGALSALCLLWALIGLCCVEEEEVGGPMNIDIGIWIWRYGIAAVAFASGAILLARADWVP